MSSSTNNQKIILVTGANQGLGHAVLEVAGHRFPNNIYILCSRDLSKGLEAALKLQQLGVQAHVDTIQLDVTNDDDIAAAVNHVSKTYGRLDVLINNAGILRGYGISESTPPSTIRSAFSDVLNVHITSVAVLTLAFTPLLRKSSFVPEVINVTSGLGSITNVLDPNRKMARAVAYGASKVGMNGLTAHMQVVENERAAAAAAEGAAAEGKRIRYYIANPGMLKTAFTGFHAMGMAPQEGAESIVRILGDEEGKYEGGMQWECVGGEMRVVPW